jgi:hypothetical protein
VLLERVRGEGDRTTPHPNLLPQGGCVATSQTIRLSSRANARDLRFLAALEIKGEGNKNGARYSQMFESFARVVAEPLLAFLRIVMVRNFLFQRTGVDKNECK